MSAPGVRVLVVDDSPFARRILREALERDPRVGTVDSAANGRAALQKALQHPPDLVTLDLHMPVMDGFTFLRLFRARSDVPVLVVTSHADLGNVERGLELGATGFVTKPSDPYRDLDSIAEELRLKVGQVIGDRSRGRRQSTDRSGSAPVAAPSRTAFPVVALGASSGGPPSLQYLLSGLPADMTAAVLIAQHMPQGFTGSFARRLDGLLPVRVREAVAGEEVCPGTVLVAPGGRDLAVRASGSGGQVVLEPPVGTHGVPSVDRLLTSAAEVFGARVTAMILTGMGRDGAAGVRAVKAAGGRVVAESEETAAVFGMPGKAAATGCVDLVLPLPEIAVELIRCAGGTADRPAA